MFWVMGETQETRPFYLVDPLSANLALGGRGAALGPLGLALSNPLIYPPWTNLPVQHHLEGLRDCWAKKPALPA